MANGTNGKRQIQVNPSVNWSTFQSHVRYLPISHQKKVKKAFEIGQEAHRDQTRMSGAPYFSHCIAVANLLADMEADSDTIIAALLHDTIEDTPTSVSDIKKQFGNEVLRLVEGLTKLRAEEFIENPTLNEKTETIRKIFTFMKEDVRIMIIKLADRLHNMQTAEFLPEEKRLPLAEETHDIYVKIADRLCMQDLRDELEELCLAHIDQDKYGKLLDLRIQGEKRGQTLVEKLGQRIKAVQPPVPIDMHYEHKAWSKLGAYLETGGNAVPGISAITMAFICDANSTCYRILGALHQCWKREELSFRDFINSPSINGYQGLHTTVILEDGTRVRCKIRTREMQEYARSGITNKCFDSKAIGLSDYLLWAERISHLSKDTADRSDDFWDSLQSDILGEATLIHGPADQRILVPKGSTALDGAFYLFGDLVLKATSIMINGEEVLFQSNIQKGVAIDVTFGRKTTVKHEWLHWVNTGLAAAHIHDALAMQDPGKKIKTGKKMLEEVMKEKGKGLLEEFKDEGLLEGIKSLGFDSIDDGYIAIAEGKIEARNVYSSLFEKNMEKQKGEENLQRYTARFSVAKEGFYETLSKLLDVYRKYEQQLTGVRIFPAILGRNAKFAITTRLHPKKCEQFRGDIAATGANNISLSSGMNWINPRIALCFLSILWGLDCLLGKKLILAGVSPYDLTALRFGVLFVISLFLIVITRSHVRNMRMQLKRLTPFNKYLFLSGGAIFITALSSYIAVQWVSVLTYALCMNIGVVFLLLWRRVKSRLILNSLTVTALMLFLVTISLLYMETGSILSTAFVAGIGCGVGFAIYSVSSHRYQVEESIRSRYPMFILFFSGIAFILSLPFMFITGFSLLRSDLLLPALSFVIFLTALPYLLYFELLKYEEGKATWAYLPLFLVVIAIGELLLYDERSWLFAIPILFAVSWHVAYKRNCTPE